MPFKKLYLFLIFLFVFILTNQVFAQKSGNTKVIEVLNADNVTYDKKFKDAQRLKGNVAFKHEGVFMYCDSALLYSKESRFNAYGHIHVKKGDSLNIYSDSLHYTAKNKHCKMWGNIRMIEKDLQLTTDSIQFNAKENIAWYDGGATITSAKTGNTLKSKNGIYHSATKRIYFKNEVTVRGKGLELDSDTLEYATIDERVIFHGPTVIRTEKMTAYCEAGWYKTKEEEAYLRQNTFVHSKEHLIYGDTISYKQIDGKGFAQGKITLKDTLQKFLIHGGHADFNLNDNYFEVTKNPVLTKILEKDSLFIYGDTLQAKQDTLNHESWFRIYHHVKYFKTNLQGKCDSIYFSEKDSLMYMLGTPIIWSDAHQITADSIKVKIANEKIEKAWLDNNCFLISKADTVGYNQVKGKNIQVYFSDDQVKKAIVIGNGQTVYYAGEKGKPYKGMNRRDCSSILIYFNEEDLEKITFITKPQSTFYPMKKINPKEKLLKDFYWNIKDRPRNKEEIYPENTKNH